MLDFIFPVKGEGGVWDVLYKVFEVTRSKKLGKKTDFFPIHKHVGIKEDAEKEDRMTTLRNTEIQLHLFYTTHEQFKEAYVAGDDTVIDLCVMDSYKAVFLYLGCFWVFHLGFSKEISSFMGFLQEAMIKQPYKGPKCVGYSQLLTSLDEEIEKMGELKDFKKLV